MTFKNIFIEYQANINAVAIDLPASKSISNRALIIDALSGGKSLLENVSEARDTQTMQRLLKSDDNQLDVLDAGTTMRFLTAYLTATNQKKILTGSARMQERPIRILVDALRTLGAKISYSNNEGFPPLNINGIDKSSPPNQIGIRGDVSSQYISALMMIAPLMESGLKIKLEGKIGSRPYIEMTQSVMRSFGVDTTFDGTTVQIPAGNYRSTNYTIEPDWSAASYWFSFIALSETSEVLLKNLKPNAIQGDSRIVEIMSKLGVTTTFNNEGALLTKSRAEDTFQYDFTDCPDLAQTIAVICAVKGIRGEYTGLESLKIKETDRVNALQAELAKFGAQLIENDNTWILQPSSSISDSVTIATYEDHRMAMAFAPLAMVTSVEIQDLEVVNKSYPKFWEDLSLAGLKLKQVD